MLTSPFKWIALALIPFSTLAQIETERFTDDELKPDSYVYAVANEGEYAYIAGSSSNSCGPTPLLSKVRIETGEIIWSTNTMSLPSEENNPHLHVIKLIDDAIYASSGTRWPDDTPSLWKFDKNSGAVIWHKNFPTSGSTVYQFKLYPYSATHLVINGAYKIYLVNRGTGDFEQTYADDWDQFMGVGLHQDIYLGYKQYLNFDFTTATQTLPKPPYNPFVDNTYDKIYPINDSTLLECGSNGVFLIDIPSSTSTRLKDASSVVVSDFKIKGGYLYACYNPEYTGSAKTGVGKYNLFTKKQEWINWSSYAILYTKQFNDSGAAISNSIDVDDAGDVYVTGVANAQNDNGNMGVMKFSGATGEKIFEKIITEDISDWDDESNGVKVIVYNNKPYCIGNVVAQAFYETREVLPRAGNNIVLARLNGVTGNLEERHDFKGHQSFPSSVQQIMPYQSGHFLVLGNNGRYLNISHYDENKELVWSKNLKHENFFGHKAFRMAADKHGNIAIASDGMTLTLNLISSVDQYYYRNVVFILDKNGVTLQELLLDNHDNSVMLDLQSDGEYFYAFDKSLVLYKIDVSGVVASKPVSNYFHPTLRNPNTQMMAFTSAEQLLIFGEYTSYEAVNKADLSYTDNGNYTILGPYDVPDYIVDVHVQGDNIYLIGKNTNAFTSIACYSLATKKVLWKGPTVGEGQNGYFNKIVLDTKGNIYALGVGQYQGFMLQKISASTGNIIWNQQRSYDSDIKATDIYYDSVHDQVLLTGYKIISGEKKYMDASFDANGTLTSLRIDAAIGSGLAVVHQAPVTLFRVVTP